MRSVQFNKIFQWDFVKVHFINYNWHKDIALPYTYTHADDTINLQGIRFWPECYYTKNIYTQTINILNITTAPWCSITAATTTTTSPAIISKVKISNSKVYYIILILYM